MCIICFWLNREIRNYIMVVNVKYIQLEDVFQTLQGKWRIDRQIVPGGMFSGDAVFMLVSKTRYDYRERGTLTTDQGDVISDVLRAYSYEMHGDDICVFYADGGDSGKLFHKISLDCHSCAQAEHLCKDDLYISRYDFSEMPKFFTLEHIVTGPKKDYVSKSFFTRG